MPMTAEITVAICTYNRADLLAGALDSLCSQAVPARIFEILVVDNGSTDNTAVCVQDFQERFPGHNIRMIYEGRQGLGLARTMAMKQAGGRYIAYLDDDARAEPDWLAQALFILQGRSEEIVCLGGPIYPFYTSPKPVWFKDAYESRSWGECERPLKLGESFSGSNMIWHKVHLERIGGFTGKLGVKGDVLSVGEETDAFNKINKQLDQPLFYYSPALRVRHWVPPFKMTVWYPLKRTFIGGQVTMKLREKPGWQLRSRILLRGAVDLLSNTLRAFWHCRRHGYWQNWLIEEGQPVMNKLGIVLASLGIFIELKQK